LVTAKCVLLGLVAVLATAVLALVAEIILIVLGWSLGSGKQQPAMSLGIDVVSLLKNRLLTPTGLTAAAVIFVLTVLLGTRRSAP
jgi:hypothetical protein